MTKATAQSKSENAAIYIFEQNDKQIVAQMNKIILLSSLRSNRMKTHKP